MLVASYRYHLPVLGPTEPLNQRAKAQGQYPKLALKSVAFDAYKLVSHYLWLSSFLLTTTNVSHIIWKIVGDVSTSPEGLGNFSFFLQKMGHFWIPPALNVLNGRIFKFDPFFSGPPCIIATSHMSHVGHLFYQYFPKNILYLSQF